ncbi:MAG: hypothetical protein ACRDNS_10760, partial [Trebonia sp.]
GWQDLATSYDASSGTLTATVPDSGSITDGTHQLRALVWDVAGNEATITSDPSAGAPASVTLPLRIVTRLIVGPARATRTQTRCRPRRVVLRRSRPRHVGRRHHGRRDHGATVARLVRTCHATRVPHATRALRLRYGQRTNLDGLLQTVDGSPIAGQTITISQQASGWSEQPAGTVTTDAQGQFSYRLPAGASRAFTFAYAGTKMLRSSDATTDVAVVGHSTIDVARHARAGHRLRISGRLAGGYVPSGGVLVQLWYRVRGVPAGFGPFEHAIATSASGAWSITFPVSRGARGYAYLFKAVVSRQSGWPFLTATTRVVARRVR